VVGGSGRLLTDQELSSQYLCGAGVIVVGGFLVVANPGELFSLRKVFWRPLYPAPCRCD
jgi:hypothetical protein